MPIRSAGILMFKRADSGIMVLLVHPGGPFWSKKDFGAWSIPKGEYDGSEDAEQAARREFFEETSAEATGNLLPLGTLRQRSGKLITGFAMEGDFEVEKLLSNSFEMEWPPRTGNIQSFPEVDRAGWFTLDEASERILPGQQPFLTELENLLGATRSEAVPPGNE
ncbi:putative NUDIX family NTP pyrophosphohydrolase [Mesorhizobium soli]|uniref:NUDIX domain-containing protein n=1 Tax=Pseudaminobacter soli (ex Li et al. 2025) TaxID=1295366 RepID=UPI002476A48E|nr:NUDIX domain-containing protein [Mesorhizobium soli]MDH6230238.1 putative NUDIX family NTP pyrophosphohydrolase [Mesorhizobium soli]